jgi:soluble lytic murein transglycosylase-like protein
MRALVIATAIGVTLPNIASQTPSSSLLARAPPIQNEQEPEAHSPQLSLTAEAAPSEVGEPQARTASEERASAASNADQGLGTSNEQTVANPAASPPSEEPTDNAPGSGESADAVPPEKFCTTLAESAQAHDLPVGFFTNLIWQESRFDAKAVSHAGAQGVAQFMPKVASEVGLSNPFDPLQALPAAARLLRSLFNHFGNFGLAAAAYNAGPKRVADWLSKRAKLPEETRHYVLTITGRPADHWRGAKPDPVAFKLPSRVPCRHMTVFAQIDHAAREQTEHAHYAAHTVRHNDLQQPKKVASMRVALSALRRVHENRRARPAQRAHAINPVSAATKTTAAAGRSATKQRHGKVADAG